MGSLVPTLFAMAGLLTLVSLMPPLARRLRLPLAVLLAAVGTGLGLVLSLVAGDQRLGVMGDLLAGIDGLELSSAAFLYIFLPVLLFETALSVDVRRLMDDLWPILLLAVVAVLVCSVLAGLGVWGAARLWYGDWETVGPIVCLLLAAIIATTDPAAVVGIFRDIGAPRRLSTLVEGESLFNDAAAIALFTLLLALLTGDGEASVGGVVGSFLFKFVGGIAVGWAMGRLCGMMVAPMRNLPQSEITVTVAVAYLTFILAETYLTVSGVVAVVTAGLVVASEGRTRISPASWEGLRHVWSQLGFWANSLIFLLASTLIPPTLMAVSPGHLVLLVALIAGALVARAMVIYGLIPALTALRAADRISGPYKAVMLWGGLRGAVSLALGLAVTENRAVPPDVKELVGVVVTGFVLFTLFVQGTTLRPLIRILRLDRLSPVELSLRNRALGLSLSDVRREIEAIAQDLRMDPSAAIRPLLDRGANLAQQQLDLEEQHGHLSCDDRLYIGLSTLARREEEMVYARYRDGILSRRMAERLFTIAGRLQDTVKAGRREGYERVAASALKIRRGLRVSLWLHRRLGWERPLATRLGRRFAEMILQRVIVQDLQRFTAQRLAPMLGHDAAKELGEVLGHRLALLEEAIAALKLQYPTYVEAVQNRYVSRAGLRFEEQTLQELYDEALITAEIVADLDRELRRRRVETDAIPRLDLGLSTSELVGRVSLFAELGEERKRRIERLLRPRLAVPGETLVRRGDRGDAMYFISSGAVAVKVPGLAQPIRLGTGEFFGEMALLFEQPRNADVVALAYCRMLVLEKRDFNVLMAADPELRAHLDGVAARRMPPAAQ